MKKSGAGEGQSASELISKRITELGDWRGDTLARMRKLIKEADPDVVEEWKWTGTPVWSHDGIICTGPNEEFDETPDDYRAAFLLAKTKGLSMLCANPDIVVDYGDKRIYCAGALAALYEEMGGEVLYFGKPHPPIYDLARRRLNAIAGPVAEDEILCVGDGINTDVLGGMQEGLDSLFLTEGLNAGQFGPADALNTEALDAWLLEEQRNPTYVMPALR